MSAKTIYLVRHGETDFNTDPVPRIRGRVDIPLNAAGELHAQQAGEFLATAEFTKIYTSEIPRARRTAELIQQARRSS